MTQTTSRTQEVLMHAKRPASVIAGPYGHPFHPILVTIPIGAWLASLVFDIAALAGFETRAFTIGAAWLIAIGVIGAVLAAIFGMIDLSRIAARTKAKRTGLIHMTINLAVVVVFIVSFFVHLNSVGDNGASDKGDASVLGFILSLIAFLALGVSGWLGGKLAYHYGVRVADEVTQAEGFTGTD